MDIQSKYLVSVYKPPLATSYESAVDVLDDVSIRWSEAQDKFLEIGRILNVAKDTLPHGQWGLLIRDYLPFRRTVTQMLRAIATAVDEHRFTIEELPTDYTSAHLLVSAPPEVIEIARERSFINNRLSRQDIKDFIKKYKTGQLARDSRDELEQETADNVDDNIGKLRKRLDAIAEERAQLDIEEADILARIADLEHRPDDN